MKAIVVALALGAGCAYSMVLKEASPVMTGISSRPTELAQWFTEKCSTCLKPGAESCAVGLQACEMSCASASCREACAKPNEACHARNRAGCSSDCRP